MIVFQFSSHIKNGNYGLSKDTDVSLWMDYRQFNGDPPLSEVANFVIINNELHSEFDEFKKKEVESHYSYIQLTELLKFYCLSEYNDILQSSRVEKFGNTYLHLHAEQIDKLIDWVARMRQLHEEGADVFTAAVLEKMFNESIGML